VNEQYDAAVRMFNLLWRANPVTVTTKDEDGDYVPMQRHEVNGLSVDEALEQLGLEEEEEEDETLPYADIENNRIVVIDSRIGEGSDWSLDPTAMQTIRDARTRGEHYVVVMLSPRHNGLATFATEADAFASYKEALGMLPKPMRVDICTKGPLGKMIEKHLANADRVQ
jgi:hypothetical protein